LTGLDHCGVLLAAHGERGAHADNSGVERLAAELSRREAAAEIGFGFIKGAPTIAEAMRAFNAPRILVYPLFMADGYFTRIRLPQLIAEAKSPGDRIVRTLPPLGLDPALAPLVAAKASSTARSGHHSDQQQVAVILLAHGSTRDAASRRATQELARQVRALDRFAVVACAFLDEPPALEDIVAHSPGPTVVVGLFAGEGLHGREDIPRLITALRRPDVLFAGNVGTWPGIVDIVAATISRPMRTTVKHPVPPHAIPRADGRTSARPARRCRATSAADGPIRGLSPAQS
jgi:sirohydrochlorin cobaltochelatase